MSFKENDKVIIKGPINLNGNTIKVYAFGVKVVKVGEKQSIIDFKGPTNNEPILVTVDNKYIEKLL